MSHKCWHCEANAPFLVSLCEACVSSLHPAVQRTYLSTGALREPLAGQIRILIVMTEMGNRKSTPSPKEKPRAKPSPLLLRLEDLDL